MPGTESVGRGEAEAILLAKEMNADLLQMMTAKAAPPQNVPESNAPAFQRCWYKRSRLDALRRWEPYWICWKSLAGCICRIGSKPKL